MSYPEESFAEEARKNREWNEQQQIELAKQIAEQRIAMGKPSPGAVPPFEEAFAEAIEKQKAALSARIEALVEKHAGACYLVEKKVYTISCTERKDRNPCHQCIMREVVRSALRELMEGKDV